MNVECQLCDVHGTLLSAIKGSSPAPRLIVSAKPVDAAFSQSSPPPPVSLLAAYEAEQHRIRAETEAEIRKQEEQIRNMRRQLDEQKAVLAVPSTQRAADIVNQDIIEVMFSPVMFSIYPQAKNAAVQAEKNQIIEQRANPIQSVE